MELRELKFLYLEGTQIDDENYGLLLSELPNIANITFFKDSADVFRHIAEERLDTITHLSGSSQGIDTLKQKCPNTTSITLYKFRRDLSGLAAFDSLRSLGIFHHHYGRSNLVVVLRGIGHRLTDLTLSDVINISVQDIITLCPSLANLSLVRCSFLCFKANSPLHSRLPHFRNLINLNIVGSLIYSPDVSFIQYYVSLKRIHLQEISIFTVKFVRKILNLGTFRQLEVFQISEGWPGALTLKALLLLLQHCIRLKHVESLRCCPRLNRFIIEKLARGLSSQNLDLSIKWWQKFYIIQTYFTGSPLLFKWKLKIVIRTAIAAQHIWSSTWRWFSVYATLIS
jgi:hypothetical protein